MGINICKQGCECGCIGKKDKEISVLNTRNSFLLKNGLFDLDLQNESPQEIVEDFNNIIYNKKISRVKSRKGKIDNNICVVLRKIVLLQRNIRAYLIRKKIKFKGSFNLFKGEKENNIMTFLPKVSKAKSNNSLVSSNLNIYMKMNSINNYDKIMQNSFNNFKTFKKEEGDIIQNSIKAKLENELMSLYQLNISNKSQELFLINSIKGYFIKKKQKFKFMGNIIEKKKNGFGHVIWEDKSYLYGVFSNNLINGFCYFQDFNGEIFQGEYKDNIPLGYGQYSKEDTFQYEGYFHKSELNGIGIESWGDENYYEGEFTLTKKKGIGLYRWYDGTIYEGEWENDQMNGWGIMTYSDGRMFEGELFNCLMNGFGIFSWPDGKKYIGYYRDGNKNGFGIFVWKNNPLLAYIGFWRRMMKNGFGVTIEGNQLTYGLWIDNKRRDCEQGTWVANKYLKGNEAHFRKVFEMERDAMISFVKSAYRECY